MRAIYTLHTVERLSISMTPDDAPPQEPWEGGRMGGDLPAAVLGIIKGMVGPAILYLPQGFASAGFVVALHIFMGTTLLFLYSSTCLLQAWQTQRVERYNRYPQRRRQ